jgi:hypothetical protein
MNDLKNTTRVAGTHKYYERKKRHSNKNKL